MKTRQILATIIASIFTIFSCISQTSPKRTISINRVEIQEGTPYSMDAPSNNVISKLGLLKRNFNSFYSYWTFPYSSTSTILNPDGSVTGKFTSSTIELSITNRGQVLSFSVVNKSQYWIGIDVSSFNFNISYFAGDEMIPYNGVDFDKTLGTLFNFERGEYDYILLPPRATSEWEMFRIDGIHKGYDIVHNCIKNGSRIDFTILVYIYDADPISTQLDKLKNKNNYQYSQYTPIETKLNYKGGYYKEGEAFHIHNDYINLVLPKYSPNIESIKLKLVGDVVISTQRIPTIKNKYGLEIYSK